MEDKLIFMSKNNFLKEQLQKIYEVIDNKDFLKALKLSQLLLNYILLSFLKEEFKIKLDNSEIIKLIEIFSSKDKELTKMLMRISDRYIIYSQRKVDKSDVEYLLESTEEVYKYIVENYGNNLLFT